MRGASHALYEQINIVGGETQESNFDTYRVMRVSEMPENKPAGIGEVVLPPTGPAEVRRGAFDKKFVDEGMGGLVEGCAERERDMAKAELEQPVAAP